MDEKKKPRLPDGASLLAWSLGISIAFNVQVIQMKKEINRQAEILDIQSEQMTKYFEQDLQFRKLEVEFWRDYYQAHQEQYRNHLVVHLHLVDSR